MIDIIAEIGSTWFSPDVERAKQNAVESIQVAQMSGATIAKFQIFRADTLYNMRRAPDLYNNTKKYELPLEWLPDLRAQSDKLKIPLWASLFDISLVEPASEYLDGIKVASGDLIYTPLLKEIAKWCNKRNLQMSISTGATTQEEIWTAINEIANIYPVSNLIVFHCKSAYPAAAVDMNLRAGTNVAYRVGHIGLSDHTMTSEAAELAIAMGYTYVEKHFKNWVVAENPDNVVALSPGEFRVYVGKLRRAEVIVGDRNKQISLSEEDERVWARRGSDGLRPMEGIAENNVSKS